MPFQVLGIPKYAAEDSTLMTQNSAGEKVAVAIPRGSNMAIHVSGLHYNRTCTPMSMSSSTFKLNWVRLSCIARYWDDPNTFKPDRFLGDWPRDSFLPFSGGARSCLGRRYVLIVVFIWPPV